MVISDCHFLNYLGGDHRNHVVSIVLSFLDENEGTSLLITNYSWSRRLLPIFEVSFRIIQHTVRDSTTHITDHTRKLRKIRHLYRVFPAHDSSTLLDRLNTTRLAKRIRHYKRNASNSGGGDNLLESKQIYRYNMTTEELAWYEWTQSRSECVSAIIQDGPTEYEYDNGGSPKFDLLRYRNPPSSSSYNFKLTDNLLQGVIRFNPSLLPPKILPGAAVLASYPRSGNTLLRSLIERITNIVTGSDTRPDRALSKSLSLQHDLVGEGVTNQKKTPIIKTHFPERRGCMMFNGSRIILLVRNPYDAIDSYWNMCCTNTHTESVAEEVYERYSAKFRSLARHEMVTWVDFLKFWLKEGNTTFKEDNVNGEGSGPSLLLVRFEDLILDTESVMEKVMKFLTIPIGGTNMDQNSELHPFWKWRIRRALGILKGSKLQSGGDHSTPSSQTNVNTSSLGSYKPRSSHNESGTSSGQNRKLSSIGKSLSKNRYTEEDLDHFHQIAKDETIMHPPTQQNVNLLEALGYDIEFAKFPNNFDQGEAQSDKFDFKYPIDNRNASTVRINKGPELRPTESPFGRAMTRWRKSQTNDDKEPFPIKK